MIKIKESIVNTDHVLIGFVVSGKGSDFGTLSTDSVDNVVMSIKALIERNFCNKQISVKGGRIVEIGDFKINQLPMRVYIPNFDVNKYPVINGFSAIKDLVPLGRTGKIKLVQRFVQDNENIGFKIEFDDFIGGTASLRYSQILKLSRWYLPDNFVIKNIKSKDKDGNIVDKEYIAGKPGTHIDELPTTVVGETSQAKKTKSGAKEADESVDNTLQNGFDILDIFDYIKMCNGAVINLPGEKYEAYDNSGKELDKLSGFASLGIGEVAGSKLMFNPVTLNASSNFKKVGIVKINFGGKPVNIVTYVFRMKNLFYHGENKLARLGVAVPKNKSDEFISKLGKSLAIKPITDEKVTAPLSQVINANELSFFEVDISHLDLISKSKQSNNILNSSEIAELLKIRFKANLITKALNDKTGLLKDMKSLLGDDTVADIEDKQLFGMFSRMSPENLKMISDAGINVYNGSFDSAKAVANAGDSLGDAAKSVKKASAAISEDDVRIEYSLEGFDASKITYNVIMKAITDKDYSKVPEDVADFIRSIMFTPDIENRINKASEEFKRAQYEIDKVNDKLWKHTVSMYLAGNKTNVHTHDSRDWEIDASSRVKIGSAYRNKKVPGLKVRLVGVNI